MPRMLGQVHSGWHRMQLPGGGWLAGVCAPALGLVTSPWAWLWATCWAGLQGSGFGSISLVYCGGCGKAMVFCLGFLPPYHLPPEIWYLLQVVCLLTLSWMPSRIREKTLIFPLDTPKAEHWLDCVCCCCLGVCFVLFLNFISVLGFSFITASEHLQVLVTSRVTCECCQLILPSSSPLCCFLGD